MKITHNDDPFFYISIENIFCEDELKIIFEEIAEIKKYFKNPEFTGSADSHFEILKKNTGMFLVEYKNYDNLKIIEIIDKLLKKLNNDNWKNTAFKRMFKSLMWGGELINEYKNNDYYKPHIDTGIFSLVIFLWDNDSNFEGGDLFFPEYDYLYKCKNNHGILFFSKELHGVTTIKSKNNLTNRYSIVSFTQTNNDSSQKRKINRSMDKISSLSYN
jgi:hypothetical protein